MPSSNSAGPTSPWNHAPSAPASRSPSCAGQTTSALSCWNGPEPLLAGKTPTAFGLSFPSPLGEGQGEGDSVHSECPLTPAISRRERGKEGEHCEVGDTSAASVRWH